ncbi:MAG: dihydroneopterin aldolase [Campylobacterales bacterium]|nr:dihydroneopterin aldolase [Campylobacterales bacterium]
MHISIEELRFHTIIGILDFERVTPQEVILNIEIEYHFETTFIDYAEVTQISKAYIIEKKFLLIEDLLSALSAKLKENFPLIQQLYIKVTKPSIMPDCRVSVAERYNF